MSEDTYNLEKFLKAQEMKYDLALKEIKAGRKRSCWIWYIFPIFDGLRKSSMSKAYAIKSLDEARAYMQNETLRKRLLEITEALLNLETNDPLAVLGYPDDNKVQACMTLFSIASPEETVFRKVLDKFYKGELHELTLEKLNIKIDDNK